VVEKEDTVINRFQTHVLVLVHVFGCIRRQNRGIITGYIGLGDADDPTRHINFGDGGQESTVPGYRQTFAAAV
jgi:hypothetical protein